MSSSSPLTALVWPFKDPDAVLDYPVNWSEWLQGDTLASVTWTIEKGSVVQDKSEFTDTIATIWLSGGIVGEQCQVVCHIVTAAGREEDQTCKLAIKER
jgi:hypothetical protein